MHSVIAVVEEMGRGKRTGILALNGSGEIVIVTDGRVFERIVRTVDE